MTALKRKKVVTSFIRHRGKILLLRRSSMVGTYQGRWAGISGYLEGDSPLARALKEIFEETGLDESQVRLVSAGRAFSVEDRDLGTSWLVHPFFFETAEPERIRLDWEHIEMQWVEPAGIVRLRTVPGLAKAFGQCSQETGTGERAG